MSVNASLMNVLQSAMISTAATSSSTAGGGVTSSQITPDVYNDWCLIFIDSPPSLLSSSTAGDASSSANGHHHHSDSSSNTNHDSSSSATADPSTSSSSSSLFDKKYRWIEWTMIEEWMQQGSSVIGNIPSKSIDQLFIQSFESMKDTLLHEKNDSLMKYQEISQQFQTYKVRAQSALKRINQEDRERIETKQTQENQEIQRLHQLIDELSLSQDNLTKDKTDLQAKNHQLLLQVQEIQSSLQTSQQDFDVQNQKLKELEEILEKYKQSHHEIIQLQQVNDKLTMEHQTLQENYSQKVKELDELSLLNHRQGHGHGQAGGQQKGNNTLHGQLVQGEGAEDIVQIPFAIPLLDKEDHRLQQQHRGFQPIQSPNSIDSELKGSGKQFLVPPPMFSPHSSSQNNTVSSPTNQQQQSKLLVFQQADHLLKENLQALREEHSNLTVEVMELRNDLSLRNEQIDALKATVRELEASLLREQEFNASNRRINADYLVNVLRKFLMTTDASERWKLVSVLCTILHLQPEESKIIAEKWAVKTSGGFVSWLLPPAPPSSSSGGGGSGGGGGKGKGGSSTMGDVTYDPVTGGGIDFSSY